MQLAQTSRPARLGRPTTRGRGKPTARGSVMARSIMGKNWLPGTQPPQWLDGSMIGDYGFDPAGLGQDKEQLERYREVELLHCRWAMLGIVGMLIPDLTGVPYTDVMACCKWRHLGLPWLCSALAAAGAEVVGSTAMDPALSSTAAAAAGTSAFEAFRANSVSDQTLEERCYPGGKFDPLGLANGDADKVRELKAKELANGRLAMISTVGWVAQVNNQHLGPLKALQYFLEDPAGHNIFTLPTLT